MPSVTRPGVYGISGSWCFTSLESGSKNRAESAHHLMSGVQCLDLVVSRSWLSSVHPNSVAAPSTSLRPVV